MDLKPSDVNLDRRDAMFAVGILILPASLQRPIRAEKVQTPPSTDG